MKTWNPILLTLWEVKDMSKLLRANFYRLSKDILFYIVLITNTILTIIFSNNLYQYGSIDSFYLTIQPIIYSAFIAFYIGKEYGNKTIRNKLICGHTRVSVYFSYLITCIVASIATILPGIIIFCVWNIRFLSAIKFSVAILILLGYLLLHCACCAVFVAVGFITPSKAVCVVIVAIVALSGILISEYTVEILSESKTLQEMVINENGMYTLVDSDTPNPNYVDGTPREILYRINNFMPQAQISEYGSCLSKWYIEWEHEKNVDTTKCDVLFKDSAVVSQDIQYRFFINQIVLITLATLGGCLLFRKKDLK